MARWTKGPTTAASNTQKNKSKTPKPWQHHQSSDFKLWLICFLILLSSTIVWFTITPETSQSSQELTQQLSPTDFKVQEQVSQSGSDEQSTLETQAEQTKKKKHDITHSLLWWIEAAPLPYPQDLLRCLSSKQKVPPQIFTQRDGISILSSRRPAPQTIYEKGEQVWVKTPLLSSPHQQAYDHLLLISCLKTPGATLFDPLLIRQWGTENWPQKNEQSQGVKLEDIFLIRSDKKYHYTHGLSRLGLPELGLVSQNLSVARELLQQLALYWIIQKESRVTLKQESHSFLFLKKSVLLKRSEKVNDWLGSKDIQVLLNQDGELLSDDDLKGLVETTFVNDEKIKIQPSSKRNQRKGFKKTKSKSTRKKRGRKKGKSRSKPSNKPTSTPGSKKSSTPFEYK